jgi:hypothetical protein
VAEELLLTTKENEGHEGKPIYSFVVLPALWRSFLSLGYFRPLYTRGLQMVSLTALNTDLSHVVTPSRQATKGVSFVSFVFLCG